MSAPKRSDRQQPRPSANAAGARCGKWPLALCNWSLQTDPEGVTRIASELGIGCVNLALKPAFQENGDAYLASVRRQPWAISAMTIGFSHEDYSSLESIRATGGIVPDAHWPQNRETVLRALAVAVDFGVPYLTLHAGFIGGPDREEALRFRRRLADLADAAAEHGRSLLLETGQETAAELRDLLVQLNHPALGVNFDPANMLLYGKGDPVEALPLLGRWIRHVHVKDAQASAVPGVWGTEVPWGQGQVGGARFLHALKHIGYDGTLVIERETGRDRFGDIRRTVAALASYAPKEGVTESEMDCGSKL